MSIGLANLGNTCYANSALQCLCRISPIAEYFISDEYRSNISKYGLNRNSASYTGFLENFAALTKALHDQNDTRAIRPISFIKYFCLFHPQFRGAIQQDSHEMLVGLLETLHDAMKINVSINITGAVKSDTDERKMKALTQYKNFLGGSGYSILNEWFGGQFESNVVCDNCKANSYTYDPFDCLSVEIPDDANNLYDCLDAFGSPFKLTDDDSYNCDKCKTKGNAMKQLKIWRTPNVLIIQLKRFSTKIVQHNNRMFATTSKNNRHIQYPMLLNFTKYNSHDVSSPLTLYDLVGVVEHSGELRGGHYTAKVKDSIGEWYSYNDASVDKVSSEEIVNTRGYLLFYTRKK